MSATRASRIVPIVITAGVVMVLVTGTLMVVRAEARINKVALTQSPQPVAVARAKSSTYRATRTYSGTFESWVASGVGPQFLSAYIDAVLVRPGALVKKGDVLATLDCRNANATTRAVAMQARAIATEQRAVADQAVRMQALLDGGMIPVIEVEQNQAKSAEEEAQLASQRARLAQLSLTVGDCILRAPFDGEVATRMLDPGAFVKPGASIVTVIDRVTVRLSADAPETDFDLLVPGTPVQVLVYATGKEVAGKIARRAPATDPETRTVHFEVDVSDAGREIPANTTGEVHIEAGKPVPATEVPISAAEIRGDRATVFVINGELVQRRTFDVIGEIGGNLYVDTSFRPGTPLVTEGRALLEDGDRVAAKEEAAP